MIVHPVHVFDDQWPFCSVAMATFNLKKKDFFKNNNSSEMTEAVEL